MVDLHRGVCPRK